MDVNATTAGKLVHGPHPNFVDAASSEAS